ncbi:unnamed protein product [Adineta ricciae]|uniref:Pentapeptide repeat-containing protein n=2 Tax=Adineta ricciae TaxID=249248 RepID=A0A814SYL9_ADIRI|nr:unnamed protein product [Adineta ricciae]
MDASSVDKSTNTDPIRKNFWRRCGLTHKVLFQVISQLLLPLLLAVFTVVITFDQRNEIRAQRTEDRYLASEQRQQDMNISRDQRDNDRQIAEQQRQHDKQIAAEKRTADDLNAAIQRNMTRDQRMYEIEVEQERYRKENEKYLDALLLSYYNEMGDLFQRINGTLLFNNPTTFSLARAKTLNVIEQVGPIRAVHLIMFLYGAGQLSVGNKSLDLTEAFLNQINLRSQRTLKHIYLIGAYLNNAVFDGQDVSYANFRGAHLNHASFRGATCIGTIFDDAHLNSADFSFANITKASFIRSNLQLSTFYRTVGNDFNFEKARMQETNFSQADFDCDFRKPSGFIDSNLARSNLQNARLRACYLVFCNLTHADFTNTDLRIANLTGSLLSYAIFQNTDLGYTLLWSSNLSFTNLANIRCSGSNYNISACKLHQALTLENSYLSNKTFGLAPEAFLTAQDRPHCQQHVLGQTFPLNNKTRWVVQLNSVFNKYRLLNESIDYKYSACVFVPKATPEAVTMIQRFNLEHYNVLIGAKRAKLTIHATRGPDVSITLTEFNKNSLQIKVDPHVGYRWTELLDEETVAIEIEITFFNAMHAAYSWLEALEIFLEADIRAPDTQLIHP